MQVSLHEPKEVERPARWPRGRHASMHSNALRVCAKCLSKIANQRPTEHTTTNPHQPT